MRSKRRTSPEIELTSLVDVVFQLIIFFVLTATFVQGSITVVLPEGTGDSLSRTPFVINVDRHGAVIINEKTVDIDEAVVLARQERSQGQSILLAGDKKAPYEAIIRVLDALKQAGVEEVSLAVGGGEKAIP